MKFLSKLLLLTIVSFDLQAFERVTEILPSGKILICKQANQIKKGNVVEVYKRIVPNSRFYTDTAKASEFNLPVKGQRITLTHSDIHQSGKKSTYHSEPLGTAIIVEDSLEGEERVNFTIGASRISTLKENRHTISKDESDNIYSNCIAAIPENGLKIADKAKVSW